MLRPHQRFFRQHSEGACHLGLTPENRARWPPGLSSDSGERGRLLASDGLEYPEQFVAGPASGFAIGKVLDEPRFRSDVVSVNEFRKSRYCRFWYIPFDNNAPSCLSCSGRFHESGTLLSALIALSPRPLDNATIFWLTER